MGTNELPPRRPTWFLYANGYDLEMPEEDFEALVIATAQSQLSKNEIAARLREHSRPGF